MNINPNLAAAMPAQLPNQATSRADVGAQYAGPAGMDTVQFGGRFFNKGGEADEYVDYSEAPISKVKVGIVAFAALLGLGTVGHVTQSNPIQQEVATVKSASGDVEGHIQRINEFKGESVHGLVSTPGPQLGPLEGRYTNDAGVVVSGDAYDVDGALVCSTHEDKIFHHPNGSPIGEEVGTFEPVSGGALFNDLDGELQGHTTRAIHNQRFHISPENQAAAACLLDIVGPDNEVQDNKKTSDRTEPGENQIIRDGELVPADEVEAEVEAEEVEADEAEVDEETEAEEN